LDSKDIRLPTTIRVILSSNDFKLPEVLRVMRSLVLCVAWLGMSLIGAMADSTAATVPFEESFSVDAANWKNSASTDPTYVATGGSDGSGFIETAFAFTSSASTTPVLFRGHDSFDASGDAFVGDWIADGITKLRAKVRHNAPQPLNFFARIASPFSFPGAVAIDFAPVSPNVWTEVEFDISAASSQFVSFEGTDFATVFSDVGNVQFGVDAPEALVSDTTQYTYQLDQVAIVPEPASWLLALGLAGFGCLSRRIRRVG
jgi:PEP-CTERM motif